MRDEVNRFIRRHHLLPERAHVLVAVSGGMDSIVLLDVLRHLGHRCQVLHVDHGLRGTESEADRAFVEAHCEALGVPCHTRKVAVKDLSVTAGTSVQMAARELRYAAARSVAAELGLGHIALAHHRDDAIETYLMELMRGGLSTIPLRSGPFVRPLLCVGRSDLAEHAERHGLMWREDASNEDPKYLRNRVRHEVLPLLEALSPSLRRVLGRSLDRLRAQGLVADAVLDELLANVGDALPLELLEHTGRGGLLLHHWLRPLGFHPDVIERVLDAVEAGHVGATFTSGVHRLTVDREALLLSGAAEPLPSISFGIDLALPAAAPFTVQRCSPATVDLGLGPSVAWLDEHALDFPLLFRPWRHGDRIRPIGLGGSKLVSDILIDAKVPAPEKERTAVLVSGDRIVWLAGHRVAEGAQARAQSHSVLRVSLK